MLSILPELITTIIITQKLLVLLLWYVNKHNLEQKGTKELS